jgi:hypothetical protein
LDISPKEQATQAIIDQLNYIKIQNSASKTKQNKIAEREKAAFKMGEMFAKSYHSMR